MKNYKIKNRKLIFSYIVFFTLCALMALSFFTKCSTDKNEYSNESSYEISIDMVEIKNNNSILNKSADIIPIICMTFFCSTGIVSLCIIVIKDDGGIRFAKLNSLAELKSEIDLHKDLKTTEEECVKDEPQENHNVKKVTKRKKLYGELSKCLMNSITEI